jgi:competence protein ComEA
MSSTIRTFLAPLLVVAAFLLTVAWGARSASAREDHARTGGAVAASPTTADRAADKSDAKKRAETTGTLNLNTATEDELQLLPGVGPSKAAAIVAWRKKHGSFKKVDDLTRVKGFGRKTLLRLRPLLSVGGTTTLRSKKGDSTSGFFGRPPAQEAP